MDGDALTAVLFTLLVVLVAIFIGEEFISTNIPDDQWSCTDQIQTTTTIPYDYICTQYTKNKDNI